LNENGRRIKKRRRFLLNHGVRIGLLYMWKIYGNYLKIKYCS
jgi:hypothetical protein